MARFLGGPRDVTNDGIVVAMQIEALMQTA